MVGWAGFTIPLVHQVFVAYVADSLWPPPPQPGSRFYIGDPRALLATVGVLAFVAAITIGVTVVPLGGWIGEWLRGRAE
jgi:hypothetical protein